MRGCARRWLSASLAPAGGAAGVHYLRNVAAAVPKQHAPAVLAVANTIFSQPTAEAAREAVNHALHLYEPRFAKVAEQLRAAESDVLAYMTFPADHWKSISSTNAIERLNAEIDRRAKVVGIFPTTASLLRLATAVVQDQHDECQDDRRLYVMTGLGATGYFMYLLGNVLFLTGVWHYSALGAGFATIPSAVVAALAARPAGSLADRRGHRAPVVVGGALWAGGCLLWALRMRSHPAYIADFLPGQLLTEAGLGVAFSVVGSAAVASIPPIRLATGTAVNAAVRQMGAVLGIALAVSVVARPSAVSPVAVFVRVWLIAGSSSSSP
jgi:hypothetical protein